METIKEEGIELLEFTDREEDIIVRTIIDGSVEAYEDLFSSIDGINAYFRELPDNAGYKPLPRLLMSIHTGFEE